VDKFKLSHADLTTPKCEVAVIGNEVFCNVDDPTHLAKRIHSSFVGSFGTSKSTLFSQMISHINREISSKIDVSKKLIALKLILIEEDSKSKPMLKHIKTVSELIEKHVPHSGQEIPIQDPYEVLSEIDLENCKFLNLKILRLNFFKNKKKVKDLQITFKINCVEVVAPVRFHLLRYFIDQTGGAIFTFFKCSKKDISREVSSADKMNTSRFTRSHRFQNINSLFNILMFKLHAVDLNVLCHFIVEMALDFGSILPQHIPEMYVKSFEEQKQTKRNKLNPFQFIVNGEFPHSFSEFCYFTSEEPDGIQNLTSGEMLIEAMGLFFMLYFTCNFTRISMFSSMNHKIFYEKMKNSHLSAFQTICNLKSYAVTFTSTKAKYTWPTQLFNGMIRYFDSILNLIICILEDSPKIEFHMNKLSQNNLEGLFGSLRQGSGGYSDLCVKQVQHLIYSKFAVNAFRKNKNTIAPSSFELIPLNNKKSVSLVDDLMKFTTQTLSELEKNVINVDYQKMLTTTKVNEFVSANVKKYFYLIGFAINKIINAFAPPKNTIVELMRKSIFEDLVDNSSTYYVKPKPEFDFFGKLIVLKLGARFNMDFSEAIIKNNLLNWCKKNLMNCELLQKSFNEIQFRNNSTDSFNFRKLIFQMIIIKFVKIFFKDQTVQFANNKPKFIPTRKNLSQVKRNTKNTLQSISVQSSQSDSQPITDSQTQI
jgi:hypothetical protein